MERVEGSVRTPQTWIRTQGKGRVFYTAYGSEKTWAGPRFPTARGAGPPLCGSRRGAEVLGRAEDARAEVRGRPQHPELREPRSAPKFQLPFTAEESMKFIQVPAGFSLELFASEPDIVKPISFTFDERGRLWVIEAMDYPNDVRNGEPGDDRIKIVEDTNGDGKADKFTVFADRLNLATSLTFANGGVDRGGGAAHAVPEGHGRRRQGGRPADPQHRMGHSRHARRAIEPAVRPGQLHLGLGRLLRVRRRDERQEAAVHAGHLPVQAGRQRLRVRDDVDEQHVGAGLLGELRRVRFDREQRSQLLRRDSEPVLRGRRRACRPRAAADRAIRARRSSTPRTTPRRTSARWTCSGATRRAADTISTPRARFRRSTGTASPSSPNRPRTSSVRESSSRTAPAS